MKQLTLCSKTVYCQFIIHFKLISNNWYILFIGQMKYYNMLHVSVVCLSDNTSFAAIVVKLKFISMLYKVCYISSIGLAI